ncbi:MAG: hypothetical protein ACR2P0_14405 [Acidimicrobiales bacterium]
MGWTEILDALEHQMKRQERAFDDGGDVPAAVIPIAPNEPMSPEQRVRAAGLQQRTDALLDRTLMAIEGNRRSRSPYSTNGS